MEINATDANITMLGESSGDEFGSSVSAAGDVNNNGYDDMIIGAPGFNNNIGIAYVFQGALNDGINISASRANATFTGQTSGAKFGFSVSGAGNLNNDNYDDVIIGAPGVDRAYIFYGGDPMNGWRQTTQGEFNSAERKVHMNTTSIFNGEVQLDTFYSIKAMMTYFDDTPSLATPYIPRNRTWNQVNWTVEKNANSIGTDDNQWFIIKSGSVRKNEKILAVSDLNKDINVQVSNGLSWGPVSELNLVVDDNGYRSFDLAYESISGDAILAYYDKNNPTSPPQYRVWNGTSWGTPMSAQPTGGVEVWWVEMASSPLSDEIIMVTLNKGTKDIYAQVWNGSGWGNVKLIEDDASRDNMQCFNVVYEQQTGYGMIVWGNATVNNKQLSYRRWIGNWSESTGNLIAADNQVNWIKLAGDPKTNNIISANLDNNKQVDVQIWNGTQWSTPKFKVTTIAERSAEQCFDVAWEAKSASQGLIAYGINDHRPAYRNITGTTVWPEYFTLDANPPDNGKKPNWVKLEADPQSDDILMMYLIDDGGGNGGAEDDIGVELWNGSSWGYTQRVEQNSTRDEAQHFDLAYTDCSGYFISMPYNTNLIAPWGRIWWTADVPIGTILKFRSRTSANGMIWSDWSDWYENYDWITNPLNKWIQYEAWFETADISLTPILYDVTIELNHPDVIINGTIGEGLGWAVSWCGDMNGDSYNDIIIGAPLSNSFQGSAYVFFGTQWSTPTYLAANSEANITFSGENMGDSFGYSVSTAGKFNGDAYDDVIVGAPYANGNGTAYIFYGDVLINGQISATIADQIETGENSNDGFGWSVACAGDIDSRWGDECLVGAPFYGSSADSGKTYIIMINTIMEITWLKTYKITDTEESNFNVGEKIKVRSKVTHSFGSDEINSVDITIKAPDNTIVLNHQPMVLEQTDGDTPSLWKLFNYTFTNPTASGEYEVEITVIESKGLTDKITTVYFLEPGPPNKITLSIAPSSVIANGHSSSNITISVYDEYGNPISGLVPFLDIKLDAGNGTFGAFTDLDNGSYTVKFTVSTIANPDAHINVSVGSIFNTAVIDLLPGPLHHLLVTPSSIDVVAGSSQVFEAEGYDEYNNTVELTGTIWSTNLGTFTTQTESNAGFEAGTEVGKGYVNASVGSIVGSAEVNLIPDILDHIIVMPNIIDIPVGETQEFIAMGYDRFGNAIELNPAWTTTVGTMDGSILTAQTKVGTGYVNATVSDITGGANVNLIPGPVGKIIIIPESVEVMAGGVQEFGAEGYDKYNNTVEIDPVWYSPVGEMSGNIFTAQTTIGRGVVNAIYKGIIGIANVTIIPAELDHIIITPKMVEVTVGRHQDFSAVGYDKYNNTVTITPIWSTNIGTMMDNVLIAQNFPGEGIVNATVILNSSQKEITGTAFVKVISDIIPGRPEIIGRIPNQIRHEDSLPWSLYLTPYESDDEDTGTDLKWYVTGVNDSLYILSGEYSDEDILTFTPQPDAYGCNKITLWLIDSDGLTAIQFIWVNLTPVNDKPVIYGAPNLIIRYDDPYIFNYEPYVYDLETPKDDLIITTLENSDHSYTIVNSLNVTFDYPIQMLNQEAFVTIIVSDGEDSSRDVIKVTITEDRVPKLFKELPDVTLYEETTVMNVFDLDDYFYDQDEDTLFYNYGETHVSVTINENHTVDIASLDEWSGVDTITFRAEDPIGALAEDSILVTVIPVNDPPTISEIPDLVVHYDYDYKFDLTYYIHDEDNETTDLRVNASDWEHIRFDDDNHLVMIINYPEIFNGKSIPVTITVSDGLEYDERIINVKVTDDYPPEVNSPLPDIEFEEDAEKINAYDLDNYFLDIDGDSLFYSYGNTNIFVTINNDNTVDFSAKFNWYGVETVTFRAEDPYGALAEDTIVVIVLPVNDAPIIHDIPSQKGQVKEMWVFDFSEYIEDVDNQITDLVIEVDSEQIVVNGLKLIFYSDQETAQTVTIDVNDGDKNATSTFSLTFSKGESVVTLTDAILFIILVIVIFLIINFLIFYKKYWGNFKIEDVFLIYNDGTLISHKTEKTREEIDDDILSCMFTAVQDFIKDSLAKNSPTKYSYSLHPYREATKIDEWRLKQLKLEDHDIYIERGEYLYIAIIFTGTAGWKLQFKLKKIMHEIEQEYSGALRNWSGNMAEVAKIGKLIQPIMKMGKGQKE